MQFNYFFNIIRILKAFFFFPFLQILKIFLNLIRGNYLIKGSILDWAILFKGLEISWKMS